MENAVIEHESNSFTKPVLSAEDIRRNVNLVQQVMKGVMKKDVHYGIIPGVDKPSLWKPGAEQLCATFRIAPSYKIEDLSTEEYFRYRVTCVGTHQTTGIVMGEGLGSCSSNEEKYKWKRASRAEWNQTDEGRRRIKYGRKKEGRTWKDYEIPQVRVEPADVDNTILKMACKRAQVAMTLNVTAASDIFTQDIEDIPEDLRDSQSGEDDEINQDAEINNRSSGPQRKSAKTAGGEQTNAGPPARKDGPAPATATNAAMTEAQRKILGKRLEGAKLTEEDLRKKFGADLVSLKASQFNDVQAWIKEAASA